MAIQFNRVKDLIGRIDPEALYDPNSPTAQEGDRVIAEFRRKQLEALGIREVQFELSPQYTPVFPVDERHWWLNSGSGVEVGTVLGKSDQLAVRLAPGTDVDAIFREAFFANTPVQFGAANYMIMDHQWGQDVSIYRLVPCQPPYQPQPLMIQGDSARVTTLEGETKPTAPQPPPVEPPSPLGRALSAPQRQRAGLPGPAYQG